MVARGASILFAAGNGNESVDLDGYASYEKVLAVAACNDRGKRSVYSDFGNAVFCCFPSNDFGFPPESRPEPLTPGIWTVDRTGRCRLQPGPGHRPDRRGYGPEVHERLWGNVECVSGSGGSGGTGDCPGIQPSGAKK